MASSWKASHGHLPGIIDPIQLAERGAHLIGTLPLKSMPRLAQGSLEGSNVNVVEELVSMIQTQRAYELNSKAIQTSDQMLQKLAQL